MASAPWGLYQGGISSAVIHVGDNVVTPADSGWISVFPVSGSPTKASVSFLISGERVPAPAGQPLNVVIGVGGELELGHPYNTAMPDDPLFYQQLRPLYFAVAVADDATYNSPAPRDRLVAQVAPVPLPACVWLLLCGIGALAPLRKKRSLEA